MLDLDFKELEERYTAFCGITNEYLRELKKFRKVYTHKTEYLKYNFPQTKLLQSKSKCPRIVRVVIK